VLSLESRWDDLDPKLVLTRPVSGADLLAATKIAAIVTAQLTGMAVFAWVFLGAA
jgi:hypothetical protein